MEEQIRTESSGWEGRSAEGEGRAEHSPRALAYGGIWAEEQEGENSP